MLFSLPNKDKKKHFANYKKRKKKKQKHRTKTVSTRTWIETKMVCHIDRDRTQKVALHFLLHTSLLHRKKKKVQFIF